MQLEQIAGKFDLPGRVDKCIPTGSGHINDSYLVVMEAAGAPRYFMQRVNHMIFTDQQALSDNILRVTTHLQSKLPEFSKRYPGLTVVRLIPTVSGDYFYPDPDGYFWRMYHHIKGKSFDLLESQQIAYQAGLAFGIFQLMLADFPATSLHEVLPGFHNIQLRLEKFRDTALEDPAGRVASVGKEIDFIESRSAEMCSLFSRGHEHPFPVRVTHNDTKCNNVIFNEEGISIAVVDLDTVMPGYVLYDFGDAIRTGASTGAEDEPDPSRVRIDLRLFEGYTGGYLSAAGRFLTQSETDQLAFSAQLMTYIIGMRFLTDYIDGDRYYKIKHPVHNLQRARAQFNLLGSMEDQFTAMQEIVNRCSVASKT